MIDVARLRQFGVYVAGGFLCAAIDIGVMQLLLLNGIPPIASSTVGFAAGLVVNYLYHSRVTFDQATSGASFVRYLVVVAMNYLLTIACVWLAVVVCDSPLTGKIVSLPIAAVNGFLLGRYWIFR